jgi:hypothetical protein
MAHGPNPTAFGTLRPDARLLRGTADSSSDIYIIYLTAAIPWTVAGRAG